MTKVRVPIAGAPGKVALIDLDPPGRAVLGKNVYIVLPDGTEALLDQNDILNGDPQPAPQVVITPQASSTSTPTSNTPLSKPVAKAKSYSLLAKPAAPTRAGTGSNIPIGPASGDLGGNYPSPTVPKLPRYLGTTTNVSNAYTSGTAPVAGYVSGVLYTAKFNAANTGAATLDGHAIYKNGAALTGAEIAANAMIALTYDGTQFNMTGDGAGPTVTQYGSLFASFSNGGLAIVSGATTDDYVVPNFNGTITGYTIGNVNNATDVGTITIDILHATAATIPVFTSMTAAATPTLSTSTNTTKTSTTLTGWTTSIVKGDFYKFRVTACANCTKGRLDIAVTKT
jgi:hypothetical protein